MDNVSPLLASIKSKKAPLRFFFNERQANVLALRSLYDAGHRRIGFPYYDKNPYQWVARRFELLRKIAASQYGQSLEILPCRQSEEPWYPRRWTGIAAPASPKPSMNAIRAGRAGLEPVRKFIADSRITALITPNDVFAHQWYFWLYHLDYNVPQDISIVSFDNAPELRMLPVSTIDFGFARLGYLAAHGFIGDIPVRADAQGNIAGISKLINRGSIAAPPPN
jgi:DNA-binding LacI/PurR family transcriptional regulator